MSSVTPQPLVPATLDSYLLEVADAVNTTLDLNTLLQRVAEMLKRVIDYEIFAILLLNEKTQELRIRFQVGHPPEVAERIRIKVGQGVTGQAVQRRTRRCWSTTLRRRKTSSTPLPACALSWRCR